MPLVSEVLNVKATADQAPALEHEMWTDCHLCNTTIRLGKARVDQTDPWETIYRCPDDGCGATILIVSTPGVVEWEGRGYRLDDWVIRNPSDLYYRPRGAQTSVKFSARIHALD